MAQDTSNDAKPGRFGAESGDHPTSTLLPMLIVGLVLIVIGMIAVTILV